MSTAKIKQSAKSNAKKRQKKGLNPDKFLEVMRRLDEINEEEKDLDGKMKSLELEKQYLQDMLQPK